MINNGTGVLLQTVLYLVHKHSPTPQNVDANTLYNVHMGNDVSESRCYEPYGCFEISAPWTSESRPVSVYPESPEKINPRYPLFTRHSPEPKFLNLYDNHSIRKAGIDPTGPMYFIAHGYLESGDRPWIKRMATELLARNDSDTASVIVVDWRGGSGPPYTQAVANIRLIGVITAHLIAAINDEYKLPNLDSVHVIGHSLGAHLAGYVGYTLIRDFGLMLGRISGLDPAEPHFAKTENVVRLDRTDAKFVDNVHTDASPFMSGGLGLSEATGHVDFFPNGGSKQPGCDQGVFQYIHLEKGSFIKGIQRFLGCNHIRSYEYFTESIAPTCPFVSIACKDYETFKNGSCFKCEQDGHHCLPFGFHVRKTYKRLAENNQFTDSRPISTYLMTSGQKPFCRGHFRVTVNISGSTESSTHGGEVGLLTMKVRSTLNVDSEKIPLANSPRYYEPKSQHTMVVPGRDVGVPRSAILEWEYHTSVFNPLTWRLLASPRLYVAWITLESLEHQSSIRLCPPYSHPVMANNPMLFQQENCR